MNRLSVKTRKKREVLDITDLVEEQLGKNGSASGIRTIRHTFRTIFFQH